MKKQILSILFLFATLVSFAQLPPADFTDDGINTKQVGFSSNTQAQINNWVFQAGITPLVHNVTTGELWWHNGTTWLCVSCSGTTTLQEAIAEDAVATSVPQFQGGVNVGNTGTSTITFNETSGSTVSSNSGGINLQHPSSINLISDIVNTSVGRVLSIDFTNYNASTNSPDLTNPYFQKEGYTTVVSVAGTQDLGNGNIDFEVGDVICFLNGDYFKLVNNNQGGGSVPDLEAVTGEGNDTPDNIIINGDDNSYFNVADGDNFRYGYLYADKLLFSRDANNLNINTPTLTGSHDFDLRDADVDLTGGSEGDVLTVQSDGSLALETPSGGGGGTDYDVYRIYLSDATSDVTVGTDLGGHERVVFGGTLVDAYVSLDDGGTVQGISVDLKKDGVSITSTEITTDATEDFSEDATTPPVFSDTTMPFGAKLTADVTQAPTGATNAILYVIIERL